MRQLHADAAVQVHRPRRQLVLCHGHLPRFRPKLFVHRGALCLFSGSQDYGDMLIGRLYTAIDADADLLDVGNWVYTPFTQFDPAWPHGAVHGGVRGLPHLARRQAHTRLPHRVRPLGELPRRQLPDLRENRELPPVPGLIAL